MLAAVRLTALLSMMLVLAAASGAAAQDAPDPDAEASAEAVTEERAGAAEASEASAEPDADVEPAPSARWSDEKVIGWGTFAASIGVAITGGILLAVGVDDVSSVENAPDGTPWANVAGARDRAPILTGTGAVVLGLGAAGAAVGAALLAAFGRDGTWLSVSVLPGGLGVSGRF